jgi:hypothetical protein
VEDEDTTVRFGNLTTYTNWALKQRVCVFGELYGFLWSNNSKIWLILFHSHYITLIYLHLIIGVPAIASR